MSKLFSFGFRNWCSVFRTEFESIRNYEFEQIKRRKRYSSVPDISVPFSSIATSTRGRIRGSAADCLLVLCARARQDPESAGH